MKKEIAIALVFTLVVGSTIAFAATSEQDEEKLPRKMFLNFKRTGEGRMIHQEFQESILDILEITRDELQALREEGKTLTEIAEDKGVLDELKSELYDAQKERLDTLVDEEKITQDEAEEFLERCQTMLDQGKLIMMRPGRPEGPGGLHNNYQQETIILDVLGITKDELKALRGEGKTLTEIASDKGVLDELKNALYDAQKERLDALVDEEKITQDKADEFLERCQSMLDDGKLMMMGPGRHKGMAPNTKP